MISASVGTVRSVSTGAGEITARTVLVFALATWPRRIVIGTLLLIPVIIAAFGGFGGTEVESHEVEPGVPVDVGAMVVTPTAFFVSDEVERSMLEIVDAEAWLGVIVEVDNLTTETLSLTFSRGVADAVSPALDAGLTTAVSWSYPDTVLRVADASNGDRALPGVTSQVALMWPISDADAVGDRLDLTMTESELTFSLMSQEEVWMSLGDVWTTSLPREDLPSTLFEPKDEL